MIIELQSLSNFYKALAMNNCVSADNLIAVCNQRSDMYINLALSEEIELESALQETKEFMDYAVEVMKNPAISRSVFGRCLSSVVKLNKQIKYNFAKKSGFIEIEEKSLNQLVSLLKEASPACGYKIAGIKRAMEDIKNINSRER